MIVINELKKIIDKSDLENPEKVKKQLDLLSKLQGEYNQQVFEKLHELALQDPKAIKIFIEHFIKTSKNLLDQ